MSKCKKLLSVLDEHGSNTKYMFGKNFILLTYFTIQLIFAIIYESHYTF